MLTLQALHGPPFLLLASVFQFSPSLDLICLVGFLCTQL